MSNDNDDGFDEEYKDEAYRQVWGSKMPDFSGNGNNNGKGNGKAKNEPQRQQEAIPEKTDIVDENLLNQNIIPYHRQYFEYVVQTVQKTVKCEDALIRQILYTGFSSYIEDDPINLGIFAATSEGKTYAVTECLKYFPDKDVMIIGKMSPMVLVRQKGVLVDKDTGEPIEGKVRELRNQKRDLERKSKATKDRDEKASLQDQADGIKLAIETIYENTKTIIDLTGKILVFLEPPQYELWGLLKPILSHDKKEIEFPFVDKTNKSNAESRDVVVRGWPACIFCSAKDESKWEIWPEIKSRVLVTSPNMSKQKYDESIKLISQKKGLPKKVQQKRIISDFEVTQAKQCVLLIKKKIEALKKKNYGEVSLWIPFLELLREQLPANKGPDMRFANRVYSLLNIIPIVKMDLRRTMAHDGETSVIVGLEDLKEVLTITQNFDGIPKNKIDFFIKVFYPCYLEQLERGPNSSVDGKKVEEMIAVTTRQLADYHKMVMNKSVSTDIIKKTFLNELSNNGIIDCIPSVVHGRQDIYYPIVIFEENESEINKLLKEKEIQEQELIKKQQEAELAEKSLRQYENAGVSLTQLEVPTDNGDGRGPKTDAAVIEESSKTLSSFSSKLGVFDKVSQFSSKIYEKISTKVSKQWLFYEITGFICHRNDYRNIETKQELIDCINNDKEFNLYESSYERYVNGNGAVLPKRLLIEEFLLKYLTITPERFDDNRGSNTAPFEERRQYWSKLANFDEFDEKVEEATTAAAEEETIQNDPQ